MTDTDVKKEVAKTGTKNVIITNMMHSNFILRGCKKTKNKEGIIVSRRTFSETLKPKVPTRIKRSFWDSVRGIVVYKALVDTKRLIVTSCENDALLKMSRTGIQSTANLSNKEKNMGALERVKPKSEGATVVEHVKSERRTTTVNVG